MDIRVSVVEPKNSQEILDEYSEVVTYIGDHEVLTKFGDIIKIEKYKLLK